MENTINFFYVLLAVVAYLLIKIAVGFGKLDKAEFEAINATSNAVRAEIKKTERPDSTKN